MLYVCVGDGASAFCLNSHEKKCSRYSTAETRRGGVKINRGGGLSNDISNLHTISVCLCRIIYVMLSNQQCIMISTSYIYY